MVDSVESFFKINVYGYGFSLFIICIDKITKIVKNSLKPRAFGSKPILEFR